MKVAFHTLGCKVNHYETEAIKEAFVSRGAEIVGEEDPADVYVINKKVPPVHPQGKEDQSGCDHSRDGLLRAGRLR